MLTSDLSAVGMKCSPDSTNIMAECPLEHQDGLEEESAKDCASRQAQLSIRGEQVLDRLLVLLPSHLRSQPMSRISPFSPALLLSICDVLQHGRTNNSGERDDTFILPSVLSKLREWRLLDQNYRYSVGGIHKLALDLAETTGEAPASTTSDASRTSRRRLRMKWVASDSHDECQDQEPSSSTPSSVVLNSAQECAHVLSDLNQRHSDAGYEPCQAGRLGIPDPEDASAIVPLARRHHSRSGLRSGCSACRHPRLSGPSNLNPLGPQMASFQQRTPFCDVNHFDRHINTSVASPRHPKPSVQRITTKKTMRENQKSLPSTPRGAHVDENEPPLPKPPSVQQCITGISFPTQSPRISNAILSREPFSPVASSVQRRMESSKYNHPNRTREGDKHTFSHRVASVDLLLPLANPSRAPTRASPIDLHPHTPNRAHSFSFTSVHSHGFGSVAGGVPKLPSSTVGRLSERLPSWSSTHRRDPATTTTTSVILSATGSLSPTPAKARSQNARSSAPSRPWIPPSVVSDVKPRDRRLMSSQTHKYTQSAGLLPLSPLLAARKWQV